jgi:poly(A) polymerase
LRIRYSTDEKGKLVKKALVYTQEEHGINNSDVDPQAIFIVERLCANGFESYIVGGAVRDLILGKKPKDFDIVSAANPARIKRIFRNARVIGNRFRLVHVYFGPKIFEVSTFRSIKDGPTSNTFGTIEEDVLRRDFTINALFYDPVKQVVVDFVGGMKDIKYKKIRPIIPVSHIFTDDPVRMIRAVKYGAATGFELPFSLRLKIRQYSFLLSEVSASRLTEEIFKIIHSSQAGCIVEDLDNAGLYKYLQPQAADLFKTKQGYKEQYLQTMASLNQEGWKDLPGEALSALIRDYLEDAADWKGDRGDPALSLAERYKAVFMAARKFVLPMNPPRLELDHAVKLLFAKHGVTLKRGRIHDKNPKDLNHNQAYSKQGAGRPEISIPESANLKASSKRRRRRRKPAESAQTPPQ